MGATIEYIAGVIRAGENHNQLEDDFEFTGTILIHNDHAVLKGFAGKMPKYFRRDMKKLMADIGVKTAEWQIDVENTVVGKDKI